MAQLREKIRIMVRNEFVSRLLAEAEDNKKDDKVYRHSNYEIPWNDLDTDKELDYKNIWQDLVNHKDLKVPRVSTKNGFVRWFLKMYIIPTNSSLKLDREDVNEVHTIYTNSKNADEFVEKVNQHRWIFDKSLGFKSEAEPDPLFKMIRAYTDISSTHVPIYFGKAKKDSSDIEEPSRTYDTAKNADAAKTTIADMLAGDVTETGTKQSVLNRIESALKHVTGDKGMVALLGDFIELPDADPDEVMDAKDILKNLHRIIDLATVKYSLMFSDAMIKAFEGIDEDDEQGQKKAFAEGVADFVEELRKRDVKIVGSQEIGVFTHVLGINVGGGKDVLDSIIHVANNPDERADYIDDITDALFDGFKEEMDKITNFDSLGDFTDKNEEVKEIRKLLNSIATRGRPAGSTAAAVAARKATV